MGYGNDVNSLGVIVNDVKGLINKRPFGIICITELGASTDNADNYQVIQDAIDNAVDGSIIYVPDGVFNYSTTLRLKTKVSLIGAGEGSVLNYTGSGDAINVIENIDNSPIQYCCIKSLSILSLVGARGLLIRSARHSEFENLYIEGGLYGEIETIGVDVQGTVNFGVYRNSFKDIIANKCSHGFKIDGQESITTRANANTFLNCNALEYSNYGWHIVNSSGLSIVGCGGESELDGVTGIYFEGCNYINIIGGWFENIGEGSVDIDTQNQTQVIGVFHTRAMNILGRVQRFRTYFESISASAASTTMSCKVVGDVNNRFLMQADGKLLWHDAATGVNDLSLQRLSAGNLGINQYANGQILGVKSKTTELTLSGTAATWTAAIDAGSMVLGVSARVTEAIVLDTGTNVNIGENGGIANLFAADMALTQGTTANLANSGSPSDLPKVYTASKTIRVAPDTGSFVSGKIRLTLHYLDIRAATS